MSEQLSYRQFGRYELIRQIAAGGMGEIYLARSRGVHGLEKRLVIKKILPSLASESEFVEKFIDEARIVTALTHGNIVPVFDMGDEEGEFYIAMEFIAGRDLRDILKVCKLSDWQMPITVAMFIMAEVCKGLAYAHHKKDLNGVSLNIVHRDISPSNILISTEGEVKIVDFGIAKATSKTSRSITNQLQGKFCYMSPEQAVGRSMDQRSDLFSVGVVLYELLTNVRPFEGRNDLDSLEKIRSYIPPPPSSIREEIPAEIDALVMKALSKDKEGRYQDSDPLSREILTWLFSNGGMSSREVSKAFEEVFPNGLTREVSKDAMLSHKRTLDNLLSSELERMLESELTPTPTASVASSGLDNTVSFVSSGKVDGFEGVERVRIGAVGDDLEDVERSVTAPLMALDEHAIKGEGGGARGLVAIPPEVEQEIEPALQSSPNPITAKREGQRKGVLLLPLVVFAVALVVVGLWVYNGFYAPGTLIVTAFPAGSEVHLNDIKRGDVEDKPLRLSNLKQGSYHVRVTHEGYIDEVRKFKLEAGEDEALQFQLVKREAAEETREIMFETSPSGADIYLNGVPTGDKTPKKLAISNSKPVGIKVVWLGESWEWTISPGGSKSKYEHDFEDEVDIVKMPQPISEKAAIVESEENASARVLFVIQPKDASLTLNGKKFGAVSSKRLKPGNYNAVFNKEGFGSARRSFRIKRGQEKATVMVELKKISATEVPSEQLVRVRFSATMGSGPISGCRFNVGGKEFRPNLGNLFLELNLTPKRHRVRVKCGQGSDVLSGTRVVDVVSLGKTKTYPIRVTAI